MSSLCFAEKTEIQIEQAWVRASIPGVKNTSAYFTIFNHTNKVLTLVSVKSDSVETVELHSHTNENGIMKMRKLDFVLIPSKGFLEFKLMSNHLMLFGLKNDLKIGDKIPFTLNFKKHKSISFFGIVKKPK